MWAWFAFNWRNSAVTKIEMICRMESEARVVPHLKPITERKLAKACVINTKRMVHAHGHLESVRGYTMNKKQHQDEDEDVAKARARAHATPLQVLLAAEKVGNHLRPEAKEANIRLLPDAARAPLVIKINRLVAFFFKAVALRCKPVCFSIPRLVNFINKASVG